MKKTFVLAILFFVSGGFLFADSILDQGNALLKDKKPDEAIQLLKKYDAEKPGDVDVNEMIQRIMLRNDKKDQALAEYKERYETHPGAVNGYLYARLLDQPSDREKVFGEIINKDPKSVWGYYGLANALMDQDRLQEGVDSATQALVIVEQPAKLHYILARIYRRMQDYENAASHMKEFYRLDPTEDNLETTRAYEWLEAEHADSFEKKFALSSRWFQKYKEAALKPESIEDDVTLAEIAFLYVKDGKDVTIVKELIASALTDIQKQEVPPSGDDRSTYFRTKGALLAIQAWTDAGEKSDASAFKNLKLAAEAGPGSEAYFFSAKTYVLLARTKDALKSAIRAASFPPVYEGSRELAEQLWKQIHGSTKGLETELHKQREEFTPQRKQLALSQMVSEKFEPFEMTDLNGKKVTKKDLAGKIVVMSFWAVWCPPCREELPHWNQFYAAHKNDPGLMFYSVGDEPWETMLNYMKNHHYSFPSYRNESYWKEFNVDGIPTLVVIDPHGAIRFRNAGFEEGMEYDQTLQWQIDAVRSQSSPSGH
jgi:thiol-disulfide isomerase/thioredoxin